MKELGDPTVVLCVPPESHLLLGRVRSLKEEGMRKRGEGPSRGKSFVFCPLTLASLLHTLVFCPSPLLSLTPLPLF